MYLILQMYGGSAVNIRLFAGGKVQLYITAASAALPQTVKPTFSINIWACTPLFTVLSLLLHHIAVTVLHIGKK